jgi:hypothetical protein
LQPLDQGIIANFKAHYKRRLASFLRDYINELPDTIANDAKATAAVTVKMAIVWAAEAWDCVLP